MCFFHVRFCSVSVRETELWLTRSVRFGQNGKTLLRSVTTSNIEVSQIHAYFFKDSFGDPFQNLILTVLEKISYGSASLKTQSLRWIQLYIHDSPPKINSPLKYTIVIWLHAIANALHCAFKKVRTSSVCRCSTFVLAVDSWYINHVSHLNLSEK